MRSHEGLIIAERRPEQTVLLYMHMYMAMPRLKGRRFLVFLHRNSMAHREEIVFFIIYGTDVGLLIAFQFDCPL